MGVWIETKQDKNAQAQRDVTPCMGVWIETIPEYWNTSKAEVTPCMGVWIETFESGGHGTIVGHTLYGCVDWNWYPESYC